MLGGTMAAHILVKLFAHWFVAVKCFVQYTAAQPLQATHVKVRHSVSTFLGHA